jgi:hypothetical protein
MAMVSSAALITASTYAAAAAGASGSAASYASAAIATAQIQQFEAARNQLVQAVNSSPALPVAFSGEMSGFELSQKEAKAIIDPISAKLAQPIPGADEKITNYVESGKAYATLEFVGGFVLGVVGGALTVNPIVIWGSLTGMFTGYPYMADAAGWPNILLAFPDMISPSVGP